MKRPIFTRDFLPRLGRFLKRQPYEFLTRLRALTPGPNELTDLANKYGSDKGDLHFQKHHYTRVYDEYMRDHKNEPVSLCELGLLHVWSKRVAGGSYDQTPSLFMWLDYFRNGTVTGFDIDDFSYVKKDRLRIVRGDQSNREDLKKLIPEDGRLYDFIIEDASHASHHQQISLGYLFKFLKPRGLYFVEDLATQPPELEPPGATKTLAFLEKLKFFGKAESSYLLEEEKNYLEANVARILFYDSCHALFSDSLAVLIKK